MRLTKTLAERVAQRMRRDGFVCESAEVQEVYEFGEMPSRANSESLSSRILQEFEELGIEVPA